MKTENAELDSPTEETSDKDFNILQPLAKLELTPEENVVRQTQYKSGKLQVQYSKIHCTACNTHIGSALKAAPHIFIHPLLHVILCRECYDYYRSGDFERDEDGTEMYCRWCGQGGIVVCCNRCPMVFCELCIKINFNHSKYVEIKQNDDWQCFACQPGQLVDLKVHSFEFQEYLLRQKANYLSDIYQNIDYTRCCSSHNWAPRRKTTKDSKSEDRPCKIPKLEPINEPVKVIKLNPADVLKAANSLRNTHPLPNNHQALNSGTLKVIQRFDGDVLAGYQQKFAQLMTNSNVRSTSGTFVGPPAMGNTSTSNFIRTISVGEPSKPLTTIPTLVPTNLPPRTAKNQENPFCYRAVQPKCHTTNQTTLQTKSKRIQDAVCSTALANCTFASTMLRLSHINMTSQYPNDYVPVYNTFQESLSTFILSLFQIQKDLNVPVCGLGATNTTQGLKANGHPMSNPLPFFGFFKQTSDNKYYHY